MVGVRGFIKGFEDFGFRAVGVEGSRVSGLGVAAMLIGLSMSIVKYPNSLLCSDTP